MGLEKAFSWEHNLSNLMRGSPTMVLRLILFNRNSVFKVVVVWGKGHDSNTLLSCIMDIEGSGLFSFLDSDKDAHIISSVSRHFRLHLYLEPYTEQYVSQLVKSQICLCFPWPHADQMIINDNY